MQLPSFVRAVLIERSFGPDQIETSCPMISSSDLPQQVTSAARASGQQPEVRPVRLSYRPSKRWLQSALLAALLAAMFFGDRGLPGGTNVRQTPVPRNSRVFLPSVARPAVARAIQGQRTCYGESSADCE